MGNKQCNLIGKDWIHKVDLVDADNNYSNIYLSDRSFSLRQSNEVGERDLEADAGHPIPQGKS